MVCDLMNGDWGDHNEWFTEIRDFERKKWMGSCDKVNK